MEIYTYYCARLYFKNNSKWMQKHLVQTETINVDNEIQLFIEMSHQIENLLDIPIKIEIVELTNNSEKQFTSEKFKYTYKSNNFEDKEV